MLFRSLEVLYLRLFSLVFHNSTYTFGIVVAAFLAALAIGAAVATWVMRHFRAEHVVAWAALLASTMVVASANAFVVTTGLEYFSLGETFATYLGGAALLVACIVLPPVAALGVLFPVLWMIPRKAPDGGPTTGRLAMFNTLGAAAGSVAASYLLLPFLGLWGSFVAISALFGVMAVVTLCSIASARLALLTGTSVTVLSVLSWFLLGGWSQPDSLRQETIVQRWETVYGWIDLVHDEHTDEWKIRQNLHYRLGATGPRSVRERRQALVPLLIHQRPKNVLFLGQGTGVTAAGALAHDQVEHATIVELIPEVVEAARLLSQFNDTVIDDVRVRVEIDDARHFLRQSSQLYDVIVSDLFVPWESHTGYLYTVEHFKAGRARLAPGGLYCQWLPLYQLGGEDFEMIADSFASVFPSTTLWWGQLDADRAMIALVGSERTPQINLTLVEKQMRLIGGRARDPLLAAPEQIHDLSAGSWKATFGARLNTDEHPRIEFGTPLSQGDRRLLTGPTLETYFDRVLDRLDEPDLGKGFSQPRQLATRRGWQRFLLFGK